MKTIFCKKCGEYLQQIKEYKRIINEQQVLIKKYKADLSQFYGGSIYEDLL